MALEQTNIGLPQRTLSQCIVVLGVLITVFHIFIAFSTTISVMQQRVFHIFALLVLFYLTRVHSSLKQGKPVLSTVNIALALAALGAGVYYWLGTMPEMMLEKGVFGITEMDFNIGMLLMFLVILSTAQCIGLPLVIIALVFLGFSLAGPHLPDLIAHRGYDLEYTTSYLGWTMEGIFGTPIGASVAYVSLYVIFGELLDRFGAGKFFIDVAYALTGRMRGGPAEAAVVASALMGSINGSAVANVVTTGTFTIPLMKRVGYSANFSGAVESVASTGGQILPPVMGAAAFVMSDMTSIPYSHIIIAALLPGLLYYFSLGLQVYLEAGRVGIKGEHASALPQLKKVFKEGYYHLIPIATLIYLLLVVELSANYAAVFAIAVLLVVGTIKTLLIEKRFPIREVIDSAVNAARTTVPVMTACAAAGIVIGIVSMTGIGVKFTQIVFQLSGDSTFAMLCMVMVACLVLGMGLPSTAAYVIAATVGAPALILAGIPILAANMFVFYFAVLSFITPPVAIAAYAAAGISKGDPMRTGLLAFFLGLAGFIIPFIYVYRPGLLILDTSTLDTLYILALCIIAITMLAGALEGWMGRQIPLFLRGMMLIVAFMLIFPDPFTDAIGVCVALAILGWLFLAWRKGLKA